MRDLVTAVVGEQVGLVFVAIAEAEETIAGRTGPGWLHCGVEEADIVSVVRY
jgi:hypothetical protein